MDCCSSIPVSVALHCLRISSVSKVIYISAGARKRTQQVEVLASKPDSLSLVPRIQRVEGENRLARGMCLTNMCTHINKEK